MPATKRSKQARSYRGETPDQRSGRRREQFLDAGKVVFGDLGFQAAKVRQICAEAGLTERYFYESFRSPIDLFEAVYDRQLETLRRVLDAAAVETTDQPDAVVADLIRVYFELLEQDPRLARILIVEVYGTTGNMDNLYQRGVQHFADMIHAVVSRGMGQEVATARASDTRQTAKAVPATTQRSAAARRKVSVAPPGDLVTEAALDAGLLSVALVGAASHLAMRWYIGGYAQPRETVVTNCQAVFSAVLRLVSKSA